jgi:hypothetical protein
LDEKGSKLDHDAKLVKTSVVGYDGVCIGDMGHIGFLVYRYFSFTMFKTTDGNGEFHIGEWHPIPVPMGRKLLVPVPHESLQKLFFSSPSLHGELIHAGITILALIHHI